ncbi:YciI-like protein [Serratia fonticola]|uniref:YciI-like protein n=1 Tax=Serratia fonticola TaxID=47917 RepID=A0A4U9U8T5_SERFO|nr:YciI-like protein [Serratia fonticola]
MLYLIYAQDVPGTLEQRMAVRPAHLARLQALRDEGRLVVAGLTRLSIATIQARLDLPVLP